MKKKLFLIVLVFVVTNLYSQKELEIGDKAPKITITDFVLNIPKDKKLDHKFIVLEFWATWCAPCLSAVPHLNALQEKYKLRNDLLFLSLTYEKPEKIKRTLEKIKFKTVVVSDQSKQTEKNFGVLGIPYTVLIDDKDYVRWIGSPEELNETLMEKFLNQIPISTTAIEDPIETDQQVEPQDETNSAETSIGTQLEMITDVNTPFLFSLSTSTKENLPTVQTISAGRILMMNFDLKPILSTINNLPETQIRIPAALAQRKYTLLYKNSAHDELVSQSKIVKNNLLACLNLKEVVEKQVVDVYNLKLTDSKKLSVSNDTNDLNHSGENDTHFIYSNAKINKLVQDLSSYHKIIISNQTGIESNLDFIIRKGTLQDVMDDCKEYGLILEKTTKEVEIYDYQYIK